MRNGKDLPMSLRGHLNNVHIVVVPDLALGQQPLL